jgi:hypothetical protein
LGGEADRAAKRTGDGEHNCGCYNSADFAVQQLLM